jgi:hypothetical protein
MLEVYLESGGIEVFDTVVSEEAFSFENRNTPAALSGVFIEADLTNQSIKLDWTDFQPYSCEKYLVAVFGAAQPDEPLFASSYDPGITVTEIPVRMDTDTLTVALSYEKNGLTSQVLRKDISLAAAARLTIETEEQTNAAQASVAYETTDRISAAVTVNGTTERLTLLGSGSFSVDLDEFYNELQVSWYPEETVCFVVKRSIYSDRTAPLLTLYENAAAITTDESSYVLAGETEPDCVLTVNGTAVVVSDDGTFLYRISLSQGDNSIAVSAKDAAGNATLQVIDIHKTSDTIFTAVGTGLSSLRKFLPLLVTFALSVLLIALIFIFSRQYGKNAPAGRIRAAAAICRNILAIGTLFLLSAAVLAFFMRANARARIDDPAFYNLAQASVADAYQAIKAYEQVDGLLQLSLILFGSCLVLSILLTLTLRRGKQKRKKTGAICPKCGAIHDEQVRFCKNCGEPMDEQPGAG